jgi:hypothetical protein
MRWEFVIGGRAAAFPQPCTSAVGFGLRLTPGFERSLMHRATAVAHRAELQHAAQRHAWSPVSAAMLCGVGHSILAPQTDDQFNAVYHVQARLKPSAGRLLGGLCWFTAAVPARLAGLLALQPVLAAQRARRGELPGSHVTFLECYQNVSECSQNSETFECLACSTC